jgi:hypothetical protein
VGAYDRRRHNSYGCLRYGGLPHSPVLVFKHKRTYERIAANEAETKRAIADSDSAKEGTARANEHIAELTAQAEEARRETAQAKLELQQIRFPRSINLEKFQERIANCP